MRPGIGGFCNGQNQQRPGLEGELRNLKKDRQNMSDWQKEWERFLEDCEQAVEISRRNLCRLMEDNKNTEYGRRYGFAGIRTAEDYQRQVPVSDYSDYEEEIARMKQGEEELLTSYEVKHYIMTSGSTGRQKRIPLTKEALDRCIFPIYYAAYACIPGIDTGRYLHLSVFRMEPPALETETILSAAYFRELYDRGTFHLEERYLGGTGLLFSKGVGVVPYVKLWIALSSPEMAGIQAFFLYDILLFLRYFEENWQQVLEDAACRRIPEKLPLSDSVRKELLKFPAPEKAWLQRVERECRKGFDGIVGRLWKRMKFVSGVGGSTFTAQEPMLRAYLGEVPVHYFTYAASECMMGITTRMESTDNVLIPKSGFYEFLPYNKEGNQSPRTMEELEVGAYYELLVTNFSGLYRYRLNDVVQVTGFCGQAPVLKICFRKNQAVNIAGEKMDLGIISSAMELLAGECNIRILEHSIYDEKSLLPGRYQCFVETDSDWSQPDAGRILDRILMEQNEDYKDLRSLGLIGEASVSRVQKGTHLECRRRFLAEQSNLKPLQYLTDQRLVAFMKERIC